MEEELDLEAFFVGGDEEFEFREAGEPAGDEGLGFREAGQGFGGAPEERGGDGAHANGEEFVGVAAAISEVGAAFVLLDAEPDAVAVGVWVGGVGGERSCRFLRFAAE